jgi:hypothetical protein
MQPARAAYCIANNPRTVQRSAAHCIATSSQRIGPRIASRASQRITSHPVQRSAPRECNQPARSALHRKQSAHRKPARHALPAAPAVYRPPQGAHLAPAALHALRSTLRWFRLVRGTNFSKIQFIYISNSNFGMTQPSYWLRCENLICGPRFESGTSRVIVVGPQRRPSCNNNFTTTEK